MRKRLSQPGHWFGTWRREVLCEGGLSHESRQSSVASPRAACPPTACSPVASSPRLATFPFVMCHDGGPELVIRGEHPWRIESRQAVPVLPRRRHEVGQPVQEVKRRELDDAVSRRSSRGRSLCMFSYRPCMVNISVGPKLEATSRVIKLPSPVALIAGLLVDRSARGYSRSNMTAPPRGSGPPTTAPSSLAEL